MKCIADVLSFLKTLRARSIVYTISQQRDDSIMISFRLKKTLVEVDFFADHIEFSYFEGGEQVAIDAATLDALLGECR